MQVILAVAVSLAAGLFIGWAWGYADGRAAEARHRIMAERMAEIDRREQP